MSDFLALFFHTLCIIQDVYYEQIPVFPSKDIKEHLKILPFQYSTPYLSVNPFT